MRGTISPGSRSGSWAASFSGSWTSAYDFPPSATGLLGRWIGADYSGGTWPDSSGNGNDGTEQGTTGSATVIGGVLEVLRGANNTGPYFTLGSDVPADHLFFVVRHEPAGSSDDQGALIGDYNGTSNASYIFLPRSGISYAISMDGSVSDVGECFDNGVSIGSGGNVGTQGHFDSAWHIIEVQMSTRADDWNELLGFDIGGATARDTFEGGIAEILAYQDILGAGDRAQTLTALRSRWGSLL